MTEPMRQTQTLTPEEIAWSGVSTSFAAFGRVFLCLDRGFRIVHASYVLDELAGAGTAAAVADRPIDELICGELFAEGGALRAALLAGERREGWRALVAGADGLQRFVALSAAPICPPPEVACDPRVAFAVILRPAEEDMPATLSGPSAFGGIVARSPAMQRIFALIENLRESDTTVLLSGESGVGKEVVARAIHEHSPRRGKPFVAVNCGALPGELLESEMFGHVRGAFTGALRDRLGRFEVASEGTLLLDEVGDLPLPLQVKLLRVLQDGSFERVGENRTRVSRARVIAATHIDLARAVREGRFREDLYYRLRVVPIDIPPLARRSEDVEPLARAILARVAARQGRALRLSPDALRDLLAHDWPGNVRELENALEYAVAICHGQTILPEDLPTFVRREQAAGSGTDGAASRRAEALVPSAQALPASLSENIAQARRRAEAEELRRALDAHSWRRTEAARALGMSRTTLWRKMREFGFAS
jgi:transcriptional regulator with GAF, ATPase, and Fis domain